jgi:hypothetical protein
MQQRFGKMKGAGIRNVRELLAKSATGTKMVASKARLVIITVIGPPAQTIQELVRKET